MLRLRRTPCRLPPLSAAVVGREHLRAWESSPSDRYPLASVSVQLRSTRLQKRASLQCAENSPRHIFARAPLHTAHRGLIALLSYVQMKHFQFSYLHTKIQSWFEKNVRFLSDGADALLFLSKLVCVVLVDPSKVTYFVACGFCVHFSPS